MGKKTANYDRLRYNTGQHRRIGLVMLFFGALAFAPVFWRLYDLMVRNYDYYAALALRNQTRTTQVAARRGEIYDRNMNILATSVHVENVYLDPHELKQSGADLEEISRVLGEILDKDPAWIREQAEDIKKRYKQVGSRIEEETAAEIREFINKGQISGIHLEPTTRRFYPFGTLAAQVIGFTNAGGDGSAGVGGHCIAVDPWFIVAQNPQQARLIRTAREVNDHKPFWVIDQVKAAVADCLAATDKRASELKIACFGLAFKPNIDDLRESPAMEIAELIAQWHSGETLVVEPNIHQLPKKLTGLCTLAQLDEALATADVLVMLVDHSQFKVINGDNVHQQYVVDAKGVWR